MLGAYRNCSTVEEMDREEKKGVFKDKILTVHPTIPGVINDSAVQPEPVPILFSRKIQSTKSTITYTKSTIIPVFF